jgi:hypothetical protein
VIPGRPLIPAGCAATAAQAVARLPRRSTSTVEVPKRPARVGLVRHSYAVVCALLIVLALGAQWIAVSNQAAAKGNGHAVPAPLTVSSGTPPLDTGE